MPMSECLFLFPSAASVDSFLSSLVSSIASVCLCFSPGAGWASCSREPENGVWKERGRGEGGGGSSAISRHPTPSAAQDGVSSILHSLSVL